MPCRQNWLQQQNLICEVDNHNFYAILTNHQPINSLDLSTDDMLRFMAFFTNKYKKIQCLFYFVISCFWVHPCELLNGIHYLTLIKLMKYVILRWQWLCSDNVTIRSPGKEDTTEENLWWHHAHAIGEFVTSSDTKRMAYKVTAGYK